MKQILFYETATGAIRRVTGLQDHVADAKAAPDGQGKLEIVGDEILGSPLLYYINLSDLVIHERQTMALAVTPSTGQADLSNLPDPCTLTWGDQSAEVSGGQATITFDEPGDYRLLVRARPQFFDYPLEVTIP